MPICEFYKKICGLISHRIFIYHIFGLAVANRSDTFILNIFCSEEESDSVSKNSDWKMKKLFLVKKKFFTKNCLIFNNSSVIFFQVESHQESITEDKARTFFQFFPKKKILWHVYLLSSEVIWELKKLWIVEEAQRELFWFWKFSNVNSHVKFQF